MENKLIRNRFTLKDLLLTISTSHKVHIDKVTENNNIEEIDSGVVGDVLYRLASEKPDILDCYVDAVASHTEGFLYQCTIDIIVA